MYKIIKGFFIVVGVYFTASIHVAKASEKQGGVSLVVAQPKDETPALATRTLPSAAIHRYSETLQRLREIDHVIHPTEPEPSLPAPFIRQLDKKTWEEGMVIKKAQIAQQEQERKVQREEQERKKLQAQAEQAKREAAIAIHHTRIPQQTFIILPLSRFSQPAAMTPDELLQFRKKIRSVYTRLLQMLDQIDSRTDHSINVLRPEIRKITDYYLPILDNPSVEKSVTLVKAIQKLHENLPDLPNSIPLAEDELAGKIGPALGILVDDFHNRFRPAATVPLSRSAAPDRNTAAVPSTTGHEPALPTPIPPQPEPHDNYASVREALDNLRKRIERNLQMGTY